MKTFTDLYPDTPEQNRIILTDETTGEQVSFNDIEVLKLQMLVLQGAIPYNKYYQMSKDVHGKEHKQYYILDGGEVNDKLQLHSTVKRLSRKVVSYQMLLKNNKIKRYAKV